MKAFLFLLGVLTLNLYAKANISLPSIISDNMVLQQQSKVKLWGWALPSEKITITTSWNNKTDTVVTTRDATWQTFLQTPKAGGPYTITLKGMNTIVLTNVLIGEVWVCSGQSNMQWNYYFGVTDIKAELPVAANANIRFFNVPIATAPYPQTDCKAQWTVCDSNTIKAFSAVAYFFGKKLNSSLNVPVGLIHSSWAGTAAEVWAPAEVVNNNDTLKAAATKQAAKQSEMPYWTTTPGYAYNAMIAPITPFAIAGTIWYQGESNTVVPSRYASLFTSMMQAWRKQWQKDFPFYWVQIAPFKYDNNGGALVREQQTKALVMPNTGMIVVSDLVEDITNIHPTNKRDVGARLANLALAKTYSQRNIPYQYPLYKSMKTDKDKVIIDFEDAAEGLIAKDKVISPLFIAGDDKTFYPAEAKILNNQLIVWSKKVPHPVAVRYAFSDTAIGNLFSKEGLPVAPFRTDEWKLE